jgi:hypothetical protein
MRKRGWYLLLIPLGLSTFSLASDNGKSPTHGTVNFQTSCSPEVADDFNHAVALLHSFEYDEARDVFVAVAKKDPTCAMAKWGEAMTDFHGLWGEYDAANGSKAAAAARTLAASNKETTAREKAYIEAVSELFSDAAIKASERGNNKPDVRGYSEPDRAAEEAYSSKMAQLHKAFPGDDEATIFYALSLDVTMKRTDKTHANERACTELLNPLFAKHPNHPGIAHYIIHCSDNPDMAAGGLAAARKYAQIAPASAHATHMPSHIFAQLGLWDEMIASNKASVRAAEQDPHASACEKVGHTLHAMYYLTFSLVQSGQLTEAKDVVGRAQKFAGTIPGGDKCGENGDLVLAGYILETGDWARAKELTISSTPYSLQPGVIWLAKGVAAVKTGDAATVKQAEDEFAKMRDAQVKQSHHGSPDNGGEMMRLAVAAWAALKSGNKDEALKLMKESAEMQQRLGGANSVFKPLREMLADMLLADGKPKEALAEYQAVLKTHPQRFNSTYGAGTAAYDAGDFAEARRYYGELTKFSRGNDRPELATARKRLEEQSAMK